MIGVNMVFFMGGPQLGELEAGLVANWLGPVFSVVSGGVGCLLTTGWTAAKTPELRHYKGDTALASDDATPRVQEQKQEIKAAALQDVQPPAAPQP
jgi:hypothetical protein